MSDSDLVWMDLEMTGLDPKSDLIIEIATVVTDAQKQEVRNKRARPDASGADDDDDSGGGGRSPQSGSGDRRRSKAARRSL